eukprot:CAMPEP_0201935296 /NCGR_PEP_ID=MMETSP0903-20130614/35194_1 /ASSEMBLY_ACC=CAM_ASM_000552 /TAXON_ID=420261 /ORGANISM="Thalassiosira antarctica, Strain CCMP982" /LENGTH=136 /DNA_ID=CAMNT_0048475691 /DNA_START=89 /DNA_END=496 /DNA_ORIENTATION=-
MSNATKTLQGYRLGFLQDNTYNVDYYRAEGASTISISQAAPQSEEEFKEWWRREVDKACHDDVVFVVLKSGPGTCQGKWLERIEEEEWYSSNEGPPGRVRTTTHSRLNKALNRREMLTDDWGENIEKGDVSNDEKG